jgi:hypothetical protein
MSMDFEEVLQAYFTAETVEEMVFERIDETLCRITAHLKEGNIFTYTDKINWGSDITTFYDTLDHLTNGVSYTFTNFDPEEEIKRFNEAAGNFYGEY